jgi:hypothetical protein
MAKSVVWPSWALVLLPLGLLHADPNVNERYPFRVPDWLWQQPDQSYVLNTEDFLSLRQDVAKLAELKKLPNTTAADALKEDIARRLARKYTVRYLDRAAIIVSDSGSGRSLALRFDPTFEESEKAMLVEAAKLFLAHALDRDVIEKAWARSTATPKPMPAQYEMENGQPKLDAAGRPVFTDDYSRFLGFRMKPASGAVFAEQMGTALSSRDGDPPALVISRYRGNVWWGGSYIGFFNDPLQRLCAELPDRGYLYIKLNADKLAPSEPHYNDPIFWASKLAHECTHSIGYDHPGYKDAAERDANNSGNEWAFVYSYEMSLYEKLQSLSQASSQ